MSGVAKEKIKKRLQLEEKDMIKYYDMMKMKNTLKGPNKKRYGKRC